MICDFAQYYGIYDWKSIPVDTAAILAWGLPAESRVFKEANHQKIDLDTFLLATIADIATLQLYKGTKKRKRPESYVKKLTTDKKESNERSFRTSDDFEAARKRIIEGM